MRALTQGVRALVCAGPLILLLAACASGMQSTVSSSTAATTATANGNIAGQQSITLESVVPRGDAQSVPEDGGKRIEKAAEATPAAPVIQPRSVFRVGAGSVSTSPPSDAFSPVYNALFTPTRDNKPGVLNDDTLTTVRFFIGPPTYQNAIDNPEVPEAVRSLAGAVPTEFNVTMVCHVCQDKAPQTKSIWYHPDARTSSVAEFAITPSFRHTRNGTGSVSFVIDRNGIELDHKLATVAVAWDNRVPQPPAPVACSYDPSIPETIGSDLILTVTHGTQGINATFRPIRPELRARLGDLVVRPDGTPKVFDLGAGSLDVLGQAMATTFVHLKALVEQNESRSVLSAVGTLPPSAQYMFDDASAREANRTLYDLGLLLYDLLFYRGDVTIRSVLDELERSGDAAIKSTGRPLRILIYSNDVYLPWQLLHREETAGNDSDPRQFWGNKFILGVIPITEQRACGRLPAAMPRPSAADILYLQYQRQGGAGTTAEIDQVTELSRRFVSVLAGTLGATGIRTIGSSKDLKSTLGTHKSSVSLVWAYTHGHSGASVEATRTGYTTVSDVRGQKIDFSQLDFVSALDLNILTCCGSVERPYFTRRPFVFLNGCETGTQGAWRTTGLSLPGTFLVRGARGVVVTEAPVWQLFGFNFAKRYLGEMAAGIEAGEAMYRTRRYFLDTGNNPFGLLYTYYGNPGVRFAPPES